MTGVDFKSLLNRPIDEVTRPPALPAGTYYGIIKSHKFGESRFADQETQQKDPVVLVMVSINEVGEDVDAEEAKAAGAIGKLMSKEFSLVPEKQWPLKMFLEGIGIDTEGKTFDVAIPEMNNAQVMFEVTSRENKKEPGQFFNDIKNIRARE